MSKDEVFCLVMEIRIFCLILLVVPNFRNEYESGMDTLLLAAQKGKYKNILNNDKVEYLDIKLEGKNTEI